jgi:hypothetical protein
VVLGGEQGTDVSVQDEVGLDPALDRLVYLRVGGVDEIAYLVADRPLPVGKRVDIGIDAGMLLVVHR